MRPVATAVAVMGLAACSSSGSGGGAGPNDSGGDSTLSSGFDDGGGSGDAGSVEDASIGPGAPDASCGAFAGDPRFTCTSDGNARARCLDGSLDEEPCATGCLRLDAGEDSICLGDASDWSCSSSVGYGTTPVDDGNYYMSEFGCYVDDAGLHTDPGDNCIPSCLSQAQAAGLCDAGGPACEEALGWYTADGARFGCLQRLRVTNPANGKSLIAVALDFGPGCTGEDNVSHAVLDSSGLVNDYLFGGPKGSTEKAVVHVVEVDDSYSLGPLP